MQTLANIGNTPIDTAILKSLLKDYKAVNNKISELEKSDKIIRLKKGLFVVSPKITGKLLSTELIANHLYGPSYVSMHTALRYYGLIPESVYTISSICTKRSRTFENSIGYFDYKRAEKEYFAIGIQQIIKDKTSFLIATPEKALCDLIINTSKLNLRYINELFIYLRDDIRFDMDELYKMNVEILEECAIYSKKKTTINNLIKIIKHEYYI